MIFYLVVILNVDLCTSGFFRYILAPYIIVYLYLETLMFKEFYRLNRSCSSVGRAPPRQGGGRWFETSRDHISKSL